MSGEEAERWGFLNRLCAPEALLPVARELAADLAAGPTFAHGMSIDDAIEAEAQAQAICMTTNDFHRAYHAFVDKRKPRFEGN